MRRFFFNLQNGVGYLRDEEGTELEDVEEAEQYAIKAIRGLLSAEVSEGRFDLRGHIDITDEADRKLLTLPFADAIEVYTGPSTPQRRRR